MTSTLSIDAPISSDCATTARFFSGMCELPDGSVQMYVHRTGDALRATLHLDGTPRASDSALIQRNRMQTTDDTMTSSRSEHTRALLRHFADLRDGTHGAATSRQ